MSAIPFTRNVIKVDDHVYLNIDHIVGIIEMQDGVGVVRIMLVNGQFDTATPVMELFDAIIVSRTMP